MIVVKKKKEKYEQFLEKMTDKEYLDRLLKRYKRKGITEYFDEFAAFSETDGKLVLDCGCGSGYFSKLLQDSGKTVVAMDINKHSIKHTKKIGVKNLIIGDVTNVPLKTGSFDNVYLLDILEHLKNPEKCLNETKRMLKPESNFFIITPNGIYKKVFERFISNFEYTHFHEFTWPEINNLTKNLGFKIVKYKPTGIPIINKINFLISRKLTSFIPHISIYFCSPSFWIKLKKDV